MFCGKCGQMIEEGSAFCSNCGEAVEQILLNTQPGNTTEEAKKAFCGKCGEMLENDSVTCKSCGATVEGQSSVPSSVQLPAIVKNKKKPIIIIVSAILALAIVISSIVVGISNAKGYEKAVADYIKLSFQGDFKKAFKYSLIDYGVVEKAMVYRIQDVMEENDVREDELLEKINKELKDFGIAITDIEDYFSAILEMQSQLLQEEYGDYKVEVKVINSREESAEEVMDYISYSNNMYEDMGVDLYDYIDMNKIKKVYSVKCRVKIEGDVDSDNEVIEHIVFKYKGDWKIVGDFSNMFLM